MSKEIRELEENSKRIIENMRPQTIAQYHIKQWLDDNFIMGCARLEYTGKDTAKVMDTVGGVMYEPCRIPHKPCGIGVLCRAYKGGNPYQSSFTADTGTYRLCADKVVCKRVYEVERILLN